MAPWASRRSVLEEHGKFKRSFKLRHPQTSKWVEVRF